MHQPLEKIWTVNNFANEFGFSPEYVRQCCRGQVDFRTGNPLHLPPGWSAEKLGRDWLLTPKRKSAIDKLRNK